MAPQVALVAGVTGVAGLALAERLVQDPEWQVYGLSRQHKEWIPSQVIYFPCDLTNEIECQEKLGGLRNVTHLFYTSWKKCSSEEDNIKVNTVMLKNLMNNLECQIKHCVLLTGLKHYVGPFHAFSQMGKSGMVCPFKETQPRLPIPNFYYDLEDVLFAAAKERDFTWSVARPNTILGFAPGNQMNLATSLAVYASLCKYAKLPFVFPGCPEALDIFLDATDAELLAKHMLWEATTPAAANQAFNVVNGDVFCWRQLWEEIAEYFGLKTGEYPGQPTILEDTMPQHEAIWAEMVETFGLEKNKMSDIATWWLVNVSFSKTSNSFGDMSKSREMGFLEYKTTSKSFFRVFSYLKQQKYIP